MKWYELLLTVLLSFAAAYLFGMKFIPLMRAKKLGQTILEVGPSWHKSKQGTPIMGGFIFIIGIFAACFTVGWLAITNGDWTPVILFLFSLGFGAIGFLDDFEKVAKKQNLGLTAPQKLILQLVLSVVFLSLLRWLGILSNQIYLPFFKVTFTLPWVIYLALAVIALTGIVNAVNFTDGVDGLLGSVTLPIMIFFTVAALLREKAGVAIFSASAAAGLVAFLIYNFNPAKIFMGDTGSLFLGGAVCAVAFALNMPLIVLVIGLIYVIEILSVVMQVTYFKATHGKRIFKMTPIHHHFEMCGWNEKKICFVFGGLTVLLCILSLLFA